MDPLLNLLPEIEQLVEKVNNFYGNLMNATREEGVALEEERRLLTTKIGYIIIGVPFTNGDAELYALDKNLEYSEVQLEVSMLNSDQE